MKFEEKLMKLRKDNAWSQEELAEELNVTRQTISKWELGQSMPDTENLSKIAITFGISVNDLLDENINSANKTIENSRGKNNKPLKIFILIIILIFVFLGIGAIIVNKIFNKVTNQVMPKSIIEMFQENSISELFNELFGQIGNVKQEIFNNKFKNLYYGDVKGSSMDDFIDEIVKSNEENKDKIITLKYKNIETSNAQEIRSVKDEMNFDKIYEIMYEYDEKGYINKAIILREKLSDFAKTSFNNTFKTLYFGSTNGFFMNGFIDTVIKSNEEHPDNIITVSYNGITTSDSNELRNMKKKFNNSNMITYEISYEYDEDGLIKKANISK